jgi:hypothetical protein
MADRDLYLYPALANARARVDEYRDKTKALVARNRDTLSEALFVAEVGGTSYAVARLSGGGGPEGRTVLGVPVELLIGAALGGAGLVLIGRADRAPQAESAKNEALAGHLLAVGAGAIAAYTSRLGFEAGLAGAKPPEEPQAAANQVSGVLPMPYYYVPAPSQWMLPSGNVAPAMVPAALPAPAAQEVMVAVAPQERTSIGADEIESAAEILDRMNRR